MVAVESSSETLAERQGVAVAQQPQAASLCARPPAAVIRCPKAPFSQAQVAAEFPKVLTASKKLPAVRHKVQHIIKTTCRWPISSRYCRLDPEKLEVGRKDFVEMEAQGIVRRSISSWSSPLHMVEKADGHVETTNCSTWPQNPNLYPPPEVHG